MRCPEQLSATARFIGAMVLAAALPAAAHHSYAMFEMQRNVTIEGTVNDFQWTNPHIWIDLTVIDKESGQQTKWSIEGSAPTSLRSYGWRLDSIKPGDWVTLVIHPLKDGTNGGSLAKIAINGKDLPTK